jgi:pyrophosphate--fructose-6-phosphate 1-phosphotransferase
MVRHAIKSGLKGESGVVGHDEGKKGMLRTIEFSRIKGGKIFDTSAKWFTRLLKDLDQPVGAKVAVGHGGDD